MGFLLYIQIGNILGNQQVVTALDSSCLSQVLQALIGLY